MKEKVSEKKRKEYVYPISNLVRIEDERFLCVSIGLDNPSSTEGGWDANQDVDGGELEL